MLHAISWPFVAVVIRSSLAYVLTLVCVPTAAHAEPITLQAAVARAEATHPDLRIATAEVDAVEGRQVTANTRRFNPELGIGASPLHVAGVTLTDYDVSLSQVFELGGKRSQRGRVASADVAAAKARRAWTRHGILLGVRRAYYLASLARSLFATAKDAQIAADEAKAATEERLRLKAGTLLEVNVAGADSGRAKRALFDAERAYLIARAELGAAVGAKPEEDLEPADDAPAPPLPLMAEEALVARALSARSDLRAIQLDRDAASAGVSLADAEAVPDIAVSLGYARQREPDLTFQRFSIGVSIPLPVFDRKQGERATARAMLRRASIEETATRWQAEREIRTALRAYFRTRDAVLAFDLDVIGKLDENLKLAKESFQSGKIGLLEFNVVRRNLVETQLAYLEARRDSVEAMLALEQAAGDVEVFQ